MTEAVTEAQAAPESPVKELKAVAEEAAMTEEVTEAETGIRVTSQRIT